MSYPVHDTFTTDNGVAIADGTQLAITRVCDSGSTLSSPSGGFGPWDKYTFQNGCLVNTVVSGNGPATILYTDAQAVYGPQQVQVTLRFYTAAGTTSFDIVLHHFVKVRWNRVSQQWELRDGSNTDALMPASSGGFLWISNAVANTFADAGRFTYGAGGGAFVSHTIRAVLSGSSPTAATLSLFVDGVQIAWAPTVASPFGASSSLSLGYDSAGQVTVTAGSQTGIWLDTLDGGLPTTTATGIVLTAPAVTGIGVPTPSDFKQLGLVGNGTGGCLTLATTPAGSVPTSDVTVTLSDDAGTGIFTGPVTITAGSTTAIVPIYKGMTAGSRTITAHETTGNGFANATVPIVVASKAYFHGGDSRSDCIASNTTTGPGVYANAAVAAFLQQQAGTKFAVYCFAVSGSTVEDAQASQAAGINVAIAALKAAGGTAYAGLWSCGNSINPSSNLAGHTTDTPAQIGTLTHTDYAAYYAALPAGTIRIAFTDARRADAGSGFAQWHGLTDPTNFNLAIDTFRSLVLANWTTYASEIVDWGGDARALAPTVSSTLWGDGTHFNACNSLTSDPTHTTVLGAPTVAALIFNAITSLMVGAGVAGGGTTRIIRTSLGGGF